MGLSKKLGGGGGGASPRGAAEVVGHVDYMWSTQAYTMREILTRFRLPCVVQCSGDAGPVLWADFRFDMRQPLLLHAARTVRKIHARSLKSTGVPPGEMQEYGPPLAIPEDYDGWFFPVGRKDPTVLPRHTRVEGAASSPARRLLVTTTLPAFTPSKIPDGSAGTRHVKHEVGVGEVLTKVDVTKGDPSVVAGSSSATAASAFVHRARQSLRCLDENQHEVIIPFNHRALIYDVAENYGSPPAKTSTISKTTTAAAAAAGGKGNSSLQPSVPGVVHTRTIISAGNAALPRVFRHVLGELPALAHAFTGILRCYSVFTEETIMAATMSRTNLSSVSKASSCLELATDSSAKFNIALNESELKRTNQYGLALKTCEELAPSYVRAIKASFTVQPVVSVLDDVDLSLYDNGKESQCAGEEESGLVPERNLVTTKATVQTAPASYDSDTGDTTADGMFVTKDSRANQEVADKPVPTDGVPQDESVTAAYVMEIEGVASDDNASVTTDDVRDDEESITTDDIDESNVDTVSISETIASEVDANSEFDISWGQLKRARSFSGSISTLTDSGTQSPSSVNSDSEDSVVNHGHLDSFRSPQSTLTRDTNSTVGTNSSKGTNSSTSEDTVVLRASAPSPVYANVQKRDKLSVFTAHTDVSMITVDPVTESVDGSERVEDSHTDCDSLDVGLHDHTMRSVWNITPTVEDLKNLSHHHHGDVTRDFNGLNAMGVGDEEAEQPICWGDSSEGNPELLLDTEEAILKVHHLSLKRGESGTSTLGCDPESSVHSSFGKLNPSELSVSSSTENVDRRYPSAKPHQPISAQSSSSSQSTVIIHPNLSAKSSTGSINSGHSALPRRRLSAKSSSASTNSSSVTVVDHPRLSAKLSTGSTSSMQSSQFPPHTMLSSRSSVQSEGTAQDLAILRLEQALNDATNFLKCGGTPTANPPIPEVETSPNNAHPGPSSLGHNGSGEASAATTLPNPTHPGLQKNTPKTKPTAPPRNSKAKSVGVEAIDESSSSVDRTPQNSSRNSLRRAGEGVIPSAHEAKDASPASALSLSEITSIPSLAGSRTAAAYTVRDFSRDRARQRKKAYYQSDTQIYHGAPQTGRQNAAHHASDSHIESAQKGGGEVLSRQVAQGPAETDSQQNENQIDLDFVKALGDRLISVSRKSSLPKYQRLQHHKDQQSDSDNSEGQDTRHPFQKRKQRSGHNATSSTGKVLEDDSMDASLKEAVLDDLDLLHEEMV